MKNTSTEETKETHDKLREILIKYNCAEYGDCIVDEICWLFDNYPNTNDVDPEDEDFDPDELKTSFNEYLYSKGYNFKTITEFSDEHFQNLLSFQKNEINFKKFISNENK